MLRLCRLVVIVATALPLAACIGSDFDISASLRPEFPVKLGTYVKTGSPDTVIDLRRFGDAYLVYNRRTKLTAYARLFRIPEYSDYLLQYYDRKKKPIVHLFLKTTDKGFEIYDIDKLPASVPDHVSRLLAPITDNDRRDNTVTVANGRRDTLYVVRELARANLKLTLAESYELRK